MNHFDQISAQLKAHDLDAVLLTGQSNRFYASGFFTPGGDATVLVTPKSSYFFTDARYTEAASRALGKTANLRELTPENRLTVQLRELFFRHAVHRVGFEDAALCVQDYERYRKAFAGFTPYCEMVPASEWLLDLRQSKDENEERTTCMNMWNRPCRSCMIQVALLLLYKCTRLWGPYVAV